MQGRLLNGAGYVGIADGMDLGHNSAQFKGQVVDGLGSGGDDNSVDPWQSALLDKTAVPDQGAPLIPVDELLLYAEADPSLLQPRQHLLACHSFDCAGRPGGR